MDSDGVNAIWLDTKNISVDGDKFDQFYCTYNGKSWLGFLTCCVGVIQIVQ